MEVTNQSADLARQIVPIPVILRERKKVYDYESHLTILQANSPHLNMLRLGSIDERNEQFHQNLQMLLRETVLYTYNKITDHLKGIIFLQRQSSKAFVHLCD